MALLGSCLLRSAAAAPAIALGRVCASSSAPVTGYEAGRTFDFRRLKKKQGWASPSALAEEDDADFWIFPREHLGNTYAVNWAINEFKITPSGQAFRNLHLRGLMMLTEGTKDAQQAIHVKTSAPVPESAFRQLSSSSEEFRQIIKATRLYLTAAPNIFVFDGAVGSNRSSEHSIRVFADNAATALWCHHRLAQTPTRNPLGFSPSIQVYVLAHAQSAPFVAFDPEEGVVVLNNVDSSKTLETVLATVLGHKETDRLTDDSFSLLVDGSVLRTGTDLSLVINSADQKAVLPSHPAFLPSLFADRHTIWTQFGLSRAFEGYSLPLSAPTSRGALVDSEQISGSLVLPHLAEHPTRAVFLAAGQRGTTLTPIASDKLSGLGVSSILQDVLKRQQVPTFLLSLSSDSSPAEIVRILGGSVVEEKVSVRIDEAPPKADAKIDQPTVEASKPEQPKAEAPKVEASKPEQPKAAAPRAEAPKAAPKPPPPQQKPAAPKGAKPGKK